MSVRAGNIVEQRLEGPVWQGIERIISGGKHGKEDVRFERIYQIDCGQLGNNLRGFMLFS